MWITLAGVDNDTPLWVGGPPRDVMVVAFDSGNIPVHLPRGTATAEIRDDSVARIIGGRVYAVSAGRTGINLAFGGVEGGASVKVVERVVHESLSLPGGALRSWRVQPGYYELRLDLPNANGKQSELVLAAYHANCAPAPRDDGQHYFCILKDDSSIIVRNPRATGGGSDRTGELTVFRMPPER
jgi:hypothetical protein